jgi:hypothetical protein
MEAARYCARCRGLSEIAADNFISSIRWGFLEIVKSDLHAVNTIRDVECDILRCYLIY